MRVRPALQNFDCLTKAPYLVNIAYHERASAVAYAQHFGVPLTGEWGGQWGTPGRAGQEGGQRGNGHCVPT